MSNDADRPLNRKGSDYRRHNNILLAPYEAIYFPIPKIASSSLKLVFSELLGVPPPIPDKPNVNPHNRTFPFVPREAIATEYVDYFRFAVVRNPFSRILSCYRNKIRPEVTDRPAFVDGVHREFVKYGKAPGFRQFGRFFKDMSFDEFIAVVDGIPDELADRHFRSQCWYLCGPNGALLPNYLARFERLQEELRYVFGRLGLPPTRIPRLESSGTGNNYREHFTQNGRALVERRYARDLELLGYQF